MASLTSAGLIDAPGHILQHKDYTCGEVFVNAGHGGSAQDAWTTSTIVGGALPTFAVGNSANKIRLSFYHGILLDGDDGRLSVILYDSTDGGSSWSTRASSSAYYYGADTATSFTRMEAPGGATFVWGPGHTNTLTFKLTCTVNTNSLAYYFHIGSNNFSKIIIEEIDV
jgi:hypothetical protein